MADLTEFAADQRTCGMLTGDATGPESNGYPASLTICGATGPGRASPSGAAGAPVTEVTRKLRWSITRSVDPPAPAVTAGS